MQRKIVYFEGINLQKRHEFTKNKGTKNIHNLWIVKNYKYSGGTTNRNAVENSLEDIYLFYDF